MSTDLKTHQIALTKGCVALVSACDYDALASVRWHAVQCSNRWYARRSVKAGGRVYAIYMHRQILGLSAEDASIVDHLNGNGLDNQRANIRATSYTQNSLNIQSSRGKSGLRCVYQQAGKFMVRVADEYVGVYESELEAAWHANVTLERLSPGVGYRNPIDRDSLIATLNRRRNEVDALITKVMGVMV